MIVALSGPSGSGKTTIARALCRIYASCASHLCESVQILHQDDFYKPEQDIPKLDTSAGKVTNWDCQDAIEMEAFTRALQTWRSHGEFSDSMKRDLELRAKEDRNDIGKTGVSESLIDRFVEQGHIPAVKGHLLIVDGFMLCQSQEVLETLDLAILLRGSYHVLKERREARSGYVTLEGFWQDPEGYFDDCVWPGYVTSHEHFFEKQDVHGPPIKQAGIVISDKVDMELDTSFEFVVDTLQEYLRAK